MGLRTAMLNYVLKIILLYLLSCNVFALTGNGDGIIYNSWHLSSSGPDHHICAPSEDAIDWAIRSLSIFGSTDDGAGNDYIRYPL